MAASLPVIATPSRVETAARCYRRHCVPDLLHLQSPSEESGALSFGTVIHAAVAQWWVTGSEAEALRMLREVYQEELHVLGEDKKHTLQLAEFMISAYCKEALKAGPMAETETSIVAVEKRLELSIEHGRLSFQIDRLAESIDGFTLVDTKTAGRLTKAWEQQWPQSLQMKLYAYGVWKKYGSIPTVIIEGLLKGVPSTLRYLTLPKWSEAILEEAAELVSYFLQKDSDIVERCGGDLSKMADFIMTKTDFSTSDCYAYYRPCPLLDLCNSEPEQRGSRLMEEFEEFVPLFLQ